MKKHQKYFHPNKINYQKIENHLIKEQNIEILLYDENKEKIDELLNHSNNTFFNELILENDKIINENLFLRDYCNDLIEKELIHSNLNQNLEEYFEKNILFPRDECNFEEILNNL